MPENDKKNDLLKELEIQSILDERHRIADREQMRKNAQKYRAKPKLQEIFSNADKKPRLKNENPLELEEKEAAKGDAEHMIVGEKTAATMKTELLMDGNQSGEQVKTPEELAEEERLAAEAAAKEAEEQAKREAEAEENRIVTLTPEYDEDTQFAGEVLGEVETFKESAAIESINSIDIDLNDAPAEDKPAENAPQTAAPDEEMSATASADKPQEAPAQPERVVSKVPVYRPEEPRNILNVKAGRFSEVVAREYEEYIRSKNPSVMAHVIRHEPKAAEDAEEKEEDTRTTQEKILSAVVGFFSKDESDDDDTPKEKKKAVEDYTGEDDEESIRFELNENIKKLFFRSVISGVIALLAIILAFITRLFPEGIIAAIPVAPAAYAVFNLLLMGTSVVLNRVAMLSGLTPLLRFKGNSDTAVAVAGVAAVIQTIAAFFTLGDFSSFNVNYYVVIVLLAFFANNVGKLLMVRRVKDNFRFLTAKGQKYAAKIYNNESVANKMLSGTPSEKNLIAYQHKTKFAANFLKISYAPDPSEDLASKLAPITTIAALAVTVLYGVVKFSFTDAFNTLALITALSIPVSTLLAVNFPVRKLCKTLNGYGAMVSGYPSIKQFCDSTAIMIDAGELFPADAIELEGIKTFENYNVDESLLCGIAILKEAQNPIANAFASVVSEAKETLPEVESVLYEDELGLVGWINGERILVGSRALMEKYRVDIPADDYEEKFVADGSQVTYLSRAGRPVAMLVTRYHADPELKSEMQRAEANGISFLIRTTDHNITDDLVAQLYNLFYRSIKVLPTGLGNVLREAQSVVEEQSRSYLITHGKAAGLARAVSGCVRIKQNISLAIVIQLIAVILGLLIASPVVLYADVSVMGTLEVLVYALFWAAAAIIAPAIQKP